MLLLYFGGGFTLGPDRIELGNDDRIGHLTQRSFTADEIQGIFFQNTLVKSTHALLGGGDHCGYLYFRVINAIANQNNIDLTRISVTVFLLNMNELPFPPFESVRRTRQKVQRECPWLAPSRVVEEYRAENEVAYREFALGG